MLKRFLQRKWYELLGVPLHLVPPLFSKTGGWYRMTTPWFYIAVADPDGARDALYLGLFSGIRIWYSINRNRKNGEVTWLRCRELCFWKISLRELHWRKHKYDRDGYWPARYVDQHGYVSL